MNICILGMKGNFNRNLGQGVQIYMHELWVNLQKRLGGSDSVSKVELGFGNGDPQRKMSFTMLSAMRGFNDYDIVHMPAPIMLNPRTDGSTVTTLHELFIVKESNPLYQGVSHEKRRFAATPSAMISRLIYKQIMGSDYLLPNSSQTADEAAESGYPRNRMFVISHAIEDEFINTRLSAKPHKKFVVGYLGSTHARKNPAFALRAFKFIQDKNMVFELWGNDNPELLGIARTDGRIAMKGFASEREKVSIYDNFDAVVVPSLYEGFGKGVFEAQSRGKPVVICKVAQIPKEVRRYCFEAQDEAHMAQIIKELKDNGYNPTIRKRAMAYARSFTWERCVDETISAYRKIVRAGS